MARKHRSRKKAESSGSLGSFLFKNATKFLFGIVLIVVVLTLAQCTIKKPEAPTWETQLTVPLINRTYHMDELIRRMDQKGIEMAGDSIRYSLSYDLDTVMLNSDNLDASDISSSFSKELGRITLNTPTVTPLTFAAASIPLLSLVFPGTVPPTSFPLINDFAGVSDFSSVRVSSGQMYVVITNNLGIQIDALTLQLYDVLNSQAIDTRSLTRTLNDGSSDSLLFDLSGKTISDSLRVIANCHTPGGTVLSAANKEVVTAIHFTGALTVRSATAKVPAVNRVDSQVVSLTETHPITDAALAGGNLQCSITNNSALSATVVVTLPELTLNGAPTVITRQVTAGGSAQVDLNLHGYHLAPNGSSTPQTVSVIANISSPGSGANQIPIDSSDNFAVSGQLYGLRFASVTGVFSATNAEITPFVQDVTVPKGFDSVQLAHAILTLNVENHINLPGSIDITVSGNNGKTLHVLGTIAAATLSTAVASQIVDTTVADFLSPLPSQITVSGNATFGDGVTPATLKDGDFVFANVNFTAPLEMIIGQTPINTDIEHQTIKQDDIDAITDHVIEAQVHYNVINRLPLGAHVRLFVSGDSTTLYTNPQVLIDSIAVHAAPTSGGVAIDTASTGYRSIVLDSTDIQVLKNANLFVGQELVLDGTNGQAVRLMPSDSISIIGRIQVNYRFDGKM